jgi:uncharacterized protein YggE
MRTLAAVFLLCAVGAAGQTTCDRDTITVTGTGTARAVPDRVSFTVGVVTTTKPVTEAFRVNNEKTNRVVKALKDLGVKDTEIQTSNFTIDSPYDSTIQAKNTQLYIVMNSVTVTRDDPKSVSTLIQAAIDAGANSASNLNFFNANPAGARDRALDLAIRDARAQAEKLASGIGRSLGPALMVSTLALPASGYFNNAVQEAITVTASAIEAGTTSLSYSSPSRTNSSSVVYLASSWD